MQQYTLTPLNSYTPPALETNVPQGEPNSIVENMPIEEFFNYLNRLLVNNPPLPADASFMKKIAEIGIGPGAKFDLSKYDSDEQKALANIPKKMISRLNAHQSKIPIHDGWTTFENTGRYGTDYFYRAFIARFGLGANLPEDALYPSCAIDEDGNQLNGQNKYTITFKEGQLPPADAFWSLTMYCPNGYFVHNELNRYTLGDRSDLDFTDGSLTIYIQHQNPGSEKEQNWLPAPSGNFNVMLRVYNPKPEMLNGTWRAPAIKKIN
jgi:hypothetical protein